MQILQIVLYSNNGRRKTLDLHPGTNIITGAPSTGKSAIIDVIEYCLGKGSYSIPRGPIRDKVSWFGLKLQFPSGEQMFVARKNRLPGEDISDDAYFEQGDEVNPPESSPERANTSIDAVIKTITRKMRISPNKLIPPSIPTYEHGEADLKHALFFCFLRQDEIAQQGTIFHRQAAQGVAPAIRATLPYFLGAAKEDQLARRHDLNLARKRQAKIERELAEQQDLQGEGLSRAYSLFSQMRHLGIIPDGEANPENIEGFINLFSKYSRWNPVLHRPNSSISNEIPRIQKDISSLRKDLADKIHDLKEAKEFASEAEGFKQELRYQEKRLESIELYEADDHQSVCPLCNQNLKDPIPSADAIRKSLGQVRNNLKITSREEPQILRHIQQLESDILRIRREISDKSDALADLVRRQEEAQNNQDLLFQQSQLIGKINYWLENVRFRDDTIPMKKALQEINEYVAQLNAELDDKKEKERLESILDVLSVRMTEFAGRVSLEHGDRPVRLDEKSLTVKIGFEDTFEPLTGIGSGRNWLSYHLIVILALHEYFVRNSRPIPRFIVLDQPSQVYFPRDNEGKTLPSTFSNLPPTGREAVLKMYNFIIGVVNDLNSQLQVIITDQAELDDPFFKAHTVATWWGDDALVPLDW